MDVISADPVVPGGARQRSYANCDFLGGVFAWFWGVFGWWFAVAEAAALDAFAWCWSLFRWWFAVAEAATLDADASGPIFSRGSLVVALAV